ncbi:hypothetical protein [Roseitranquillus sediminis]|uniref:hypothetical protein n=1 Tax=Roseitranquillus sediminis TaxID=2809051 RepID=UPI001D0C1C7E|nr:hypothetical protein [Roseitranquillus sediminis]MBM9596127.1 hypothetical protein [Roseitranquillus sediminis]
MKRQDLARLRAVAETLYEAELAKLRGNAAAATAVQQQVDRLRGERVMRADEMRGLTAPDPAQLGSADLHWDRWTGEHLRRLQAERARLEAEAEALRDGARLAFGRGQALDAVAEKLKAEALKRARRRAET